MQVCDACMSPNGVGRVVLTHSPLGRGQAATLLDEAELCLQCRGQIHGRLRDLLIVLDLGFADGQSVTDAEEVPNG